MTFSPEQDLEAVNATRIVGATPPNPAQRPARSQVLHVSMNSRR